MHWKENMDFILMLLSMKDIIKLNYQEHNFFGTKSFLRKK
jgi:hypothetical protein